MATGITNLRVGSTIFALATGVVLGVVGNSYFNGSVEIQDDLVVRGNITASGSEMNIYGDLTEANYTAKGGALGSGSGWSIQNQYDEAIRCISMIIRVTTAASPTTKIDVNRGTGALTEPGATTGSTLFGGSSYGDGLALAVGIHNSSGTLLFRETSETYDLSTQSGTITVLDKAPINFILDEADGTNDYIMLDVEPGSGTGQDLVASYFLECYGLD